LPEDEVNEHWLVRRSTIRLLWILFLALLALTLLLQWFLPVEGHFGIDSSLGFNGWYGFAACAAMIVFAKALGWLLKRPDTYYERDQGNGEHD